MSSSALRGLTKNKAGKDPAKAQAQKMLRTLCKFVLPLVQRGGGQTINAKKIRFGVEAEEFVTELEKFISGMISRTRPRSQKIAIEAKLEKDWLDYSEGTSWLWDIATPGNEVTIGAVSRGEVNPGRIPAIPSMPSDLRNGLQDLRRHVMQNMPIRLLFFEPHNGKLNISLYEKAEIYNYFALKLQASYDVHKSIPWLSGWIDQRARYATLSHTWNQTPGELTYGDWQSGSYDDTHPKCQKLVNFCKVAWEKYGLNFGWIDTVCINKESSAELDESIRSMYAWYAKAKLCITYLAGTKILSDMRNDPWFTRGWTLQELVAPYNIAFYNMDWKLISSGDSSRSDKENSLIVKEIQFATTITPTELRHPIAEASISRRMQLAAKRQVTREEDMAYCLMGIFDVSISTAYGEGASRAFFRLVEEIFRSTKNISHIFNWAANRESSSRRPITSLFPARPSDYLNRLLDWEWCPWRPIEPLTLTHLGLRTPILLMPAVPVHDSLLDYQPIGAYCATISIAPFNDGFGLEIPKNYHLLDKRFSGPEGLYEVQSAKWSVTKTYTFTFGILNVEEQRTRIHIPKTCQAVLLGSIVKFVYSGEVQAISSAYIRLYTEKPIIFNLKKARNNSDETGAKRYYEFERNKLAEHGMELVTLYL